LRGLRIIHLDEAEAFSGAPVHPFDRVRRIYSVNGKKMPILIHMDEANL
jgi:hypothetical protein